MTGTGKPRSSTSLKRISAILSHARSLNSLRKLSSSSENFARYSRNRSFRESPRAARKYILECFHGETARAFSCHTHVIVRRRNGRGRRRQEASKVPFLACKLLSNNRPLRVISVHSERERERAASAKALALSRDGRIKTPKQSSRKASSLDCSTGYLFCTQASATGTRTAHLRLNVGADVRTRRVTRRRDNVELVKLSLLACDGSIMFARHLE